MTGRLARTIGVALLLAAGSSLLFAQQRDASPARPISRGTATITGQVLVDDPSAKPLRRVTVTLTDSAGLVPARLAITDEAGRFTFRDVPAGRFGLSAARAPYLTMAYGAKKPTRPGGVTSSTPIALSEGQHLAGLTIKLPRGAVITGVIRDVMGQPASGYSVGLAYFARSLTTGERTLTPYYLQGPSQTDDRGTYRLYGLPPGEYVVSATFTSIRDVSPTTDGEVQRAFDLLQAPGTPAPAVASTRRPTVGFVPVYFPGTTSATEATPIVLTVGEERAGVDLQMQSVSTARIEGTLRGPDGRPVARSPVRAAATSAGGSGNELFFYTSASTTSDTEGRFTLTGLVPGSYSVQAYSSSSPAAGSPSQIALWASADVFVQGQDLVSDLTLAPALTVRGRITLDGAAPAPDLTKVRLVFQPVGGAPASPIASGTANGEGTVTVTGVIPGRYRVSSGLPAGAGMIPTWVVRSITLGGQDAADFPVTIGPGQDGLEAVVTLTDRITELSGTMSDASGRPATDYFVIVYSADRSFWIPSSRRIMQARPAQDGRFSFKNLPPGDYLLAAVTEVEQGQWFDPAFLGQLVDASAKIPLGDGEKKVQDIRIR